jgi:hypothetical protein
MLLYVFWASLWLGLMGLSAEPYRHVQYAKHPKPSRNGPPRGITKMADRTADIH